MSSREQRVGRNEALFRQVNEQIEGVNRAFALVTRTMEVVCECADLECTERISLTIDDYERVRADPRLFVLVPGHERRDVEDVVQAPGGYVVVRKRAGGPAELAERLNPR
jgi:hypothetical protein